MSILINDSELNRRYCEALSSGVYRGISGHAIGRNKRNDLRIIDKLGKKNKKEVVGVLTKLLDAEQFSRFKTSQFKVFTEVNAEDAAERIREYIAGQINALGRKHNIYSETFGEHTVESGKTVVYEGNKHTGVLVTVPIIEIPEGDSGGLGQRMFSYVYNIFSRPGIVARWSELPGGEFANRSLRRWIDFDGKSLVI